MTEAQAQQIIDFLFGMLRPPDPVATRAAWLQQLAPLDAELASRAAVNGSRVWERFPAWPTFQAEYRSLLERSRQDVEVCKTCSGNRFVVVALRKPQATDWMKKHGLQVPSEEMTEEYAPCPDCAGNVDASFRRFDGSLAVPPDPAAVRKLLQS